MAEQTQWEYRVVAMGHWWGYKAEEVEAALNALGQEGWEVVSSVPTYGSGRVLIVAKRPLGQAERRRRSYP